MAKGHGYFVWSKTPMGVQEVRIFQCPSVSTCTPTRKTRSQVLGSSTQHLRPDWFAGGEEKSYIASNADVQGGSPAEVQHSRDEGVAPKRRVPRESGLESFSSRLFPGD